MPGVELRRHEISEEDLKTVLVEPESLERTVKGRMNATKVVGERIIRVTHQVEEARIAIVTVTPRRRI